MEARAPSLNGHDAAPEEQPTGALQALQAEVAAPDAASAGAGATAAAQDVAPSQSGFLERARMRRRVRYLRALREVQLRDIGGFLLELRRFERQRPDLVEAKLASAAETNAELRALEIRLGEDAPLRQLREPGVGGACPACGAVHGSLDRFCASCGESLRHPA